MKQRQVIGSLALPADQQAAVAVLPTPGAFDDPAPRSAAVQRADEERRLTALALAPDVGHDAAAPHRPPAVGIIVALVQAEVLGAARATRRLEQHGVERALQAPFVVHVRRAQHGGQWDAAPVSQEVALGPLLRPVRGVRARGVPPFGALMSKASRADHFHWIPRRRS